MKVFELMHRLAEMPAGADVKFSTALTVAELIENPVVCAEGDPIYSLTADVNDTESGEDTVYIYVD